MFDPQAISGEPGDRLCPEAIYNACVREAEAMGFGWFLYGVRVPLATARPYQFILSGYPPEWRKHYDAHNYVDIDPVVHHAMTSVLPLDWAHASREDPVVTTMFQEAEDAGLQHGLTIPVHGAKGEFSLLSLCGPDALPASKAARQEIMLAAHGLALRVHEAVRTNVLSAHMASGSDTELTRRERECLRWVAAGMNKDEIARRIKVSARTVVFHLQNCADKLGVRGRQHAAARAIELGVIEPITYPTLISSSQNLIEGKGDARPH